MNAYTPVRHTYRGEDLPRTTSAPAGESLEGPDADSDDPNARRIVAFGLRNPFRIAVRPGGNDLWLGDVGAGEFDLNDQFSRFVADIGVDDTSRSRPLGTRDDTRRPDEPIHASRRGSRIGRLGACGRGQPPVSQELTARYAS